MDKAERLKRISSGIFAVVEAAQRQARSRGVDVINLGIGSPDRPPGEHIRRRLAEEVMDGEKYGYAIFGFPQLHEAAAGWYRQRFGVELDPKREVLDVIGSQEGLSHLSLAVINEGDTALVPDPGYPIYHAGPLLAGANLYYMKLLEENRYLPDFSSIPEEVLRSAKMMILNYPNNPLSATADLDFFEEVVGLARRYGILVVHDAAYSELAFDGYRPPSLLQVPGAKEVAIEFNSLSKTFNLAGARIGFVYGNSEVIGHLRELKGHIDYGIFKPVQYAAIEALTGPQEVARENAMAYQRRRDILVGGLREAGWEIDYPKATMFVWARVPTDQTSEDFALDLLDRTGVMVVPGTGFGPSGEGYVRIGLVAPDDRLHEAVKRIKESGILKK